MKCNKMKHLHGGISNVRALACRDKPIDYNSNNMNHEQSKNKLTYARTFVEANIS